MIDPTEQAEQTKWKEQDRIINKLAELAWNVEYRVMTSKQLQDLYELTKHMAQSAKAEMEIRR